jgi:hypothetical protein
MYVCLLCLYVVLSCVGREVSATSRSPTVCLCVIKKPQNRGQGPIWAVQP